MNFPSSTEQTALYNILFKNNTSITDIQLSLLDRYCKELLEWNKKINLVSRRDQENIWRQHILMSLSILFYVLIEDGAAVLDLGTGGGLPGIPLGIMVPRARFVLLDSIRNKCDAVRNIIDALKVSNVSVVCSRAETLGGVKNQIHYYDAVIARSVTSLDRLMQWSYPLLKKKNVISKVRLKNKNKPTEKKSCLVTLKGGELAKELSDATALFPFATIQSIPLIFNGSEILQNQDKKLLFVQF